MRAADSIIVSVNLSADKRHPPRPDQACGGGFAQQFGKNMLHADVLVTQTLGESLGVGDSLGDPLRNRDRAHFRARPAHGRTLLQNRLQRRDQRLGGDATRSRTRGTKPSS